MTPMILPDREVIGALRVLTNAAPTAMARVLAWMQASLDERRKANDLLEGVELHRSQGMALTLDCQIDIFVEAPRITSTTGVYAGQGTPARQPGDTEREVVSAPSGM